MMLNEKIESIVYKAWRKQRGNYWYDYESRYSDWISEWLKKEELEETLKENFGPEWQNIVEIHEIKVTHERIS